jgi:hypothetical protein
MTTDPRIPLREAAARLAGYPRFQKTNTRGRRELLRLLQIEQIRAAFDFPSKARPRIDIAASFWVDTKSGDFDAQLVSNSKNGKHGQFLVKPVEFIEKYVSWFSNNYVRDSISAEGRTSANVELASALANMRTRREAYILESEWARFVRDAGLDQVEQEDDSVKSTRGRRPREFWDVVLVEVASEMLARQAQGGNLEEQQKTIAAAALSRAEKQKKGALAFKVGTVTKKIREILDGRDALQKSLSESAGQGP